MDIHARNLRVDLKRREHALPGEDLTADLANPQPCDRILLQQRDSQIHAVLNSLSHEQAEVIRLSMV